MNSPPEPCFLMKGDMASVHCLLFDQSSSGDYLYAGTLDGTIHIWDLQYNRTVQTLSPSDNTCLSIHLIHDCLLTQDKYGLVKLWKPSNGLHFECTFTMHSKHLSFCRVQTYKTLLAIPKENSSVQVFTVDTTDHQLVSLVHLKNTTGTKLGEVLLLKIVEVDDTPYVIVVYENGTVAFWHLPSGMLKNHENITTETPMCLEFDADKLQGVCGTNEKEMIGFKVDQDFRIIKRKSIQITNAGVGCVRVREDKKILAAGCWDGKVRIFSWKTFNLLAVLECHQETVLDVCFSKDTVAGWSGKYLLACASSDKKISVWDIYN